MSEASYPERIEAAERELLAARAERDRLYPGSPNWERAQDKVREWERLLSDLRASS